MSRKDRNKEVFHDTQCFYLGSVELMTAVAATRRKQELILEEETVPAPAVTREKDCAVVVSGKRTLEAAHAYKGKKTCVLNFASAVNPGGGVLWGSGAQEESICRCSTLYPCLDTKEMWNGYYDPHREKRNPLNNDDMIYSPDVLVIKTDTDMPERLEKKDWYPVNVITCAAPDLRWSHHFNPFEEMESAEIPEEEFRALLESRIRRIFREAAAEGNDVLILGAFGCGAFHNPPRLVADVFRQITEEYRRCFETIEYAVFHAGSESENYLAFKEAFKTMTGC
ncbi:MAG: TIGR02452 family protein [Clostridia bacterium]|nr:TIGR02452 family protein [Clostridia bacterium]